MTYVLHIRRLAAVLISVALVCAALAPAATAHYGYVPSPDSGETDLGGLGGGPTTTTDSGGELDWLYAGVGVALGIGVLSAAATHRRIRQARESRTPAATG